MTTYPKSPKEMTGGMMYFPRMLDKIRLHGRGELHEDPILFAVKDPITYLVGIISAVLLALATLDGQFGVN